MEVDKDRILRLLIIDFPRLKIVWREKWTTVEPEYTINLSLPVKNVLLTYTETPPCMNEMECRKALQDLQREQMEMGFADIHWNFMIGGTGKVYEGRGWDIVPQKTQEFEVMDRKSLDIAYIGRDKSDVNDAMKFAWGNILKLSVAEWFVSDTYNIIEAKTDYDINVIFQESDYECDDYKARMIKETGDKYLFGKEKISKKHRKGNASNDNPSDNSSSMSKEEEKLDKYYGNEFANIRGNSKKSKKKKKDKLDKLISYYEESYKSDESIENGDGLNEVNQGSVGNIKRKRDKEKIQEKIGKLISGVEDIPPGYKLHCDNDECFKETETKEDEGHIIEKGKLKKDKKEHKKTIPTSVKTKKLKEAELNSEQDVKAPEKEITTTKKRKKTKKEKPQQVVSTPKTQSRMQEKIMKFIKRSRSR